MEDSKKNALPLQGNRRQSAALIGGVVLAHAVQNGTKCVDMIPIAAISVERRTGRGFASRSAVSQRRSPATSITWCNIRSPGCNLALTRCSTPIDN